MKSTTKKRTQGALLRRAVMIRLLLVFMLGLCGEAYAQFDSGAVLGNIKDPTGAVISTATVELLNVSKGVKVVRQTDSSGGYEFDSVQPGDYTISVTAAGFQSSKTDVFRVNVGARQRVDLALTLGSTGETVTVSGAATQLETDTSDRGQTVQGVEAVTLPLNGRSYADLAQLVPGVRRSLIATVASNPPRDASYNVNGLNSMDNNFTLDGIDNNAYQEANQGYSNEAVIPSPDALQEFKVQTDNYSAEYGRSGGAIVNATTRSGTNALHGGVYDYFRNTVLNAFGPFSGTGVKPTLVQNQFGGTFGGPIFKDKLFFFVDYEGLRSVSHALTTATLPTEAELNGLFTVDGTASGTPIPIQNPYNKSIVYTNGQVPLNDPNIDPVALAAFKLLPTPNIPGAGLTAANFQYLPAAPTVDDKGDARVDFIRSDSQNGFFRYSQRAVTYFQPPPFPGAAGGNSNGTLYARTRQLAAGYNWTLTPSSILELRFGETWTQSGKQPVFLGAPNFLAGIPNVPQDPTYTGGLNAQAVSGFTQFGEQGTSPQYNNPTQANPKINYTWVRGHHSLKVGYEFGWLSQAISDFHPKFGQDTYAGSFSSAGSATTAQAANLADFLFGARSNYQLNAVNEVNYLRYWHMGYVQDDWKVRPNLTLNLGMRYEFMSPNYEQDNKVYNFDPTSGRLLTPGSGTDINSTAPGHVYDIHYVGGDSLSDRGLVNLNLKNFGPRIGFAYQPLPKTVVRGGYGISYAYLFRMGGEGLLAYNGPNNYDATLPTNQTPSQGLCTSLTQDPTTCFRRTQDGYQTDFAGPTNFSTTKAQTRYLPKDFKPAYVQAFHLSVQQELPQQLTLEVSYVGNHTVHEATLEDFNQARTCLPSEVPAGAAGQCNTSLLNRRPIANFTDILTYSNAGSLLYHSLQTKLQRRFNNGIFLINSFTWSRGIDLASADLETQNGDSALINKYNPSGDRGPSGYNQPLNDTTSAIVDLPFGRGHRFGASAPGWQQQLLGGWQLTGINVVTSGVPINLTYTPSSNQVVSTTSAAYSIRPNLTGSPSSVYGHHLVKTSSALNGYLVAGSGSTPPPGVSIPSGTELFGNAGRNNLRGPAFGQFDLAAHKKFTLPNERYNAEFRIEAFNLFNATNYISPSSAVGSVNSTSGAPTYSTGFGSFSGSSSVYPSRQVQLVLRLAFQIPSSGGRQSTLPTSRKTKEQTPISHPHARKDFSLSQRNHSFNRREFLLQSSTLAIASLIPATLVGQASTPEPHIPNRDTTLKFNPDGTRRPFAGNTIICHLPVQCAMRDAMVELHEALAQAPFRNKLGLTSTDSYHMTIFPGANDQDRPAYGWPSYVPANATIEDCNRMVGEKMAKARFSCQLPLRMRIDEGYTVNYGTACSLRLIAVNHEEETKLRSLRDQIAEVYGFRLKDHTTYQFHMTMSYQMAPFTAEEQSAYRNLLRTYIQRLIAAQPILELGIPEYCTFPDMFRFEPQKLLVCS